MSLEGERDGRLQLTAGRVASVPIGSTRPDISGTLLQGAAGRDALASVYAVS